MLGKENKFDINSVERINLKKFSIQEYVDDATYSSYIQGKQDAYNEINEILSYHICVSKDYHEMVSQLTQYLKERRYK